MSLIATVSRTTSLIVLSAAALQAQGRTVNVVGTPQCAGCSIELTKVATVGSSSDPVLFVNYSSVYRGPRNTILVATTLYANPPALLVYDSAGTFVRQVGRPGQGPGEFPSFVSVIGIGRGDSLFLRERQGRVQVFTPDFSFGRVIPEFGIQMSPNMVLPNGNFLRMVTPSRGEGVGAPLGLLQPDGKEIRRFGFASPEEVDTDYTFSTRYANITRDGTRFWVTRRNQYDLQRFTLEGERDLTVKVEGSLWMTPWLTPPTAPYTSVTDVEDAGANRVWILGQVPSRGATTFLRPNTAAWPMRLEQNLSTVIDIIDTERGSLLASRRFENEIYRFLDGDHVYRQNEDATGIISFDIFRISMRER
jgi:hypothetical protein